MKPAHGPEIGFSLGSRFEGQPQSNPEEIIGAALAGCYSMALSMALEQAGAKPEHIETRAEAVLAKQGDGFAITSISLHCVAKASGIDAAKFATVAEQTKQGCPVSKALSGTKIILTAKLG